jgi:hypothetical protein
MHKRRRSGRSGSLEERLAKRIKRLRHANAELLSSRECLRREMAELLSLREEVLRKETASRMRLAHQRRAVPLTSATRKHPVG